MAKSLIPWSDENGWNQPQYYSTIRAADINGDARAELMGRSSTGIETWSFDPIMRQWQIVSSSTPGWDDANGWNRPEYYSTIQCADLDSDGQAELLARASWGITAWKYDKEARRWGQLPNGPRWDDANGWNRPEYYSTIQCADIEGYGGAELLGRSAGGLESWDYYLAWSWGQI